jgi:hypothetical protein
MKTISLERNCQNKLKIDAKIVSTKLKINNGILSSNYILYIIKVITPYNKWYIQKRYSDFEKLNNSLTKYFDLNKLFPPKRFFKNSELIIQERTKKFNEYLYFLLKYYDILKNQELIEFFKIKKEIIDLYIKNSSMILNEYGREKNNFLSKSFSSFNINSLQLNNDNYFILFEDFKISSEEIKDKTQITKYVIEEFLRNLDSQIENMGEIVKTFLAYLRYNNKWKKLLKEEIIKLFVGGNLNNYDDKDYDLTINYSSEETQNSTFISFMENKSLINPIYVNGLFFHIGNFKQNYLGSISCLNLLFELLDLEKNPDGEFYRKIFRNCKFEHFQLMNLIELSQLKNYLKENICFEIMRIYFNINDDNIDKNIYNIYGNDKLFINRFENWNKKQYQ